VETFNRLQSVHWSIWAASGFAFGLVCLLGGTHLWQAWRRYRARQRARTAYREHARESAEETRNDKVLISDAEATSTPVTGRVLECSVSTISLQVADSVNRGTRLSWRPLDAPATFGWATVEVKQASRDGVYWKLACRFIRTPPWVTRFLVEAPEYSSASAGSE
jgi:hypothetical protein